MPVTKYALEAAAAKPGEVVYVSVEDLREVVGAITRHDVAEIVQDAMKLHPKVKAGGLVGLVATGLTVVAAAAGVEIPDVSGAAEALYVAGGVVAAVVAGFVKKS